MRLKLNYYNTLNISAVITSAIGIIVFIFMTVGFIINYSNYEKNAIVRFGKITYCKVYTDSMFISIETENNIIRNYSIYGQNLKNLKINEKVKIIYTSNRNVIGVLKNDKFLIDNRSQYKKNMLNSAFTKLLAIFVLGFIGYFSLKRLFSPC